METKNSRRIVRVASLAFFLASAAPLAAQTLFIPPPLPEGPGKALVETQCSVCHPVGEVYLSPGYTAQGWRAMIAGMVNFGGNTADETEIANYLGQHFPPNTKRLGVTVPGPLKVTFKDWVAPTLGQRPRDPVEGPDGTIWYVGQHISILGRIDPKTGAIKEYPLAEDTLPHSANIGPDGTIWVMGNGNATLGRFDPATEKYTAIKLTDPNAKDPHTAEFDAKGIMWFTLQHSNRVGRFDPATGAMRFAELPTEKSRPYGIQIAADGTPWVSCYGSNCLIKVDPASMALTEVKLPDAAARARRLAVAPDGMIYYVNSSLGRLGRLNPSTGEIKEWPSPSGPKSHPYAIAFNKGAIWYNESGSRPDMLVRFDPLTEQFQSWPIPSGPIFSGILRHMRPTRSGDLLIHQGATNRVGIVKIAR